MNTIEGTPFERSVPFVFREVRDRIDEIDDADDSTNRARKAEGHGCKTMAASQHALAGRRWKRTGAAAGKPRRFPTGLIAIGLRVLAATGLENNPHRHVRNRGRG